MTTRSLRSGRLRAGLALAVAAGLLVPLTSLPPASSTPATPASPAVPGPAGTRRGRGRGLPGHGRRAAGRELVRLLGRVGQARAGVPLPDAADQHRRPAGQRGRHDHRARRHDVHRRPRRRQRRPGGPYGHLVGRGAGDGHHRARPRECRRHHRPAPHASCGATSPPPASVTVGGTTTDVTSHGPKVIPPGRGVRHRALRRPPVPGRARAVHRPRLPGQPRARPRAPCSTPRASRARPSTSTRRCRSASSTPRARSPPTASTTADFGSYGPGFDFSTTEVRARPAPASPSRTPRSRSEDTPLYPERITDGVYNLPGQTAVVRLRRQRLRAHRRAGRCRRAAGRSTPAAVRPASWSATRRRSPTRRSTTPTTTPTRTASSTSSWPSSPAAAATAPPSSASPAAPTPTPRTTTSGRTRRAWSSTTPTRRPACPASPPTTSSRTSRASRSGTPTTAATR